MSKPSDKRILYHICKIFLHFCYFFSYAFFDTVRNAVIFTISHHFYLVDWSFCWTVASLSLLKLFSFVIIKIQCLFISFFYICGDFIFKSRLKNCILSIKSYFGLVVDQQNKECVFYVIWWGGNELCLSEFPWFEWNPEYSIELLFYNNWYKRSISLNWK